MKKVIWLMMTIMAVMMFGGCTSDSNSYTTNEAPLEPATPTEGTSAVIEATADNESSVGIQYTNLDNGSINMSCGDDCSLTVYDAQKVIDETTEEECEEGFVWCPIEKKCIPDES